MNSKTPLWLPSPRKFQGFQDLSTSYGERPNVYFLPEEGPLTVPLSRKHQPPHSRSSSCLSVHCLLLRTLFKKEGTLFPASSCSALAPSPSQE